MSRWTIEIDQRCGTELCTECRRPVGSGSTLRLVRSDRDEAVCRDCGRRHAPALAALLDLARTAQRVARTHRPTLVPPLNALLDLARAAESYAHALHERRRIAA